MAYGARFVRKLRGLGHLEGAYVIVPELHKDGEHYHVHVALPTRRVGRGQFSYPKSVLCAAHPFGFVDVVRFTNRKRGNGAGVRAAAGYVAKYVGKSYEDGSAGRHRYECAEGFQPEAVHIFAPTMGDWVSEALYVMGGEVPATSWRSDPATWRGPPAIAIGWEGG
jgi:hypothetical protein